MIKTEDYDIVGSYNNQIISSIDAERSVNLFEYHDMHGKKPKALVNTSGLINTQFVFDGVTGGFRAQFVFKNTMFCVVGNQVFQITNIGSLTFIGTISNSTGYVGIDANTFQVIIVNGVNGYIWDTVLNTFTLIADAAFPAKPIDVCYLDGFFIVANGDTNNFQLSSFDQGLVWGPASNFYSASAVTNLLTVGLSTLTPAGTPGTGNYATGVAVNLTAPIDSNIFTTNYSGGDLSHLILTSTTNYPTGAPVKLSNTGGSLPSALVAGTKYYVINTSPTTIQLATTYANSLVPTPIADIGSDSTGISTITNQIPDGLNSLDTYYVINISPTTIKLATTLANAQSGTAIVLLSAGGGTNIIVSQGQLQQGSITTHPGNIVACRTLHRRLFLFSIFYTEVWENAGIGTNLPFRRNNSLLMEYGTPCIGSVTVGFDLMCFLGQTRDGLGSVMQVSGTEAQPISNTALDATLSNYANLNQVEDCRAFLINENNIIFYRMNFTAANHTFVYNVSMSDPTSDDRKLWHEEETLHGDRHVSQTHAYMKIIQPNLVSNNFVGHYSRPILYMLNRNTYSNDGEAIRRMRITKAIVPPGYQRIRIDRLQVDLLQGSTANIDSQFEELNLLAENSDELLTENGLNIILQQGKITGSPDELYVFLSISKDGGQSYGYRVRATMGNLGQRTYRTLWRKLGVIPRGQAFVCKFEFFQEVPFIIMGASWAQEVLPE